MAATTHLRPPDGVDTALELVQPSLLKPVLDRLGAKAALEELTSRNDPMLLSREPPNVPTQLLLC
jgi:hypothetical protein